MSRFLRISLIALYLSLCSSAVAEPLRPATSSTIPYREEKPVQESTSRALIASAILLGLAAVAFFVVKRRMPRALGRKDASRTLVVLESANLGASSRLWVVEFEGEKLLVAQNGSQITLLSKHLVNGGIALPEGRVE